MRSVDRFATTTALYEAFPELHVKVGATATEQMPGVFVKALLEAGQFPQVITLCAYLLQRREAVIWGCSCSRLLLSASDGKDADVEGLRAAEAWVAQPDDLHRRRALDIGKNGSSENPFNWVALAAGWSGGSLSGHANETKPVPAYMTARAIRIALLLGAVTLPGQSRQAFLKTGGLMGLRIAEGREPDEA